MEPEAPSDACIRKRVFSLGTLFQQGGLNGG